MEMEMEKKRSKSNEAELVISGTTFPKVPNDEPQSSIKEGSEEKVSSVLKVEEEEKIIVDDIKPNRTSSQSSCEYISEEEEEEEDSVEDGESKRTSLIVLSPVAESICCMCKNKIPRCDKKLTIKNPTSRQDPYVEFPKCGCSSHLSCLIKTRWVQKNKAVCPSCSEPPLSVPLERVREILAKNRNYSDAPDTELPDTAERKQLAEFLIKVLTLKHKYDMAAKYVGKGTHDYTPIWDYIKKSGEVTFDDFISLGFDVSKIYKYVTSDFDELCDKYCFSLDNLKNEQNLVDMCINYHLDADMLREKFSKRFNLQKIKELRLTARGMTALGLTTHKMCMMGLSKDAFKDFHWLTMNDWIKGLNFTPYHIEFLGIRACDFSKHGVMHEKILWSIEGLQQSLNLSAQDLVKLKLHGKYSTYEWDDSSYPESVNGRYGTKGYSRPHYRKSRGHGRSAHNTHRTPSVIFQGKRPSQRDREKHRHINTELERRIFALEEQSGVTIVTRLPTEEEDEASSLPNVARLSRNQKKQYKQLNEVRSAILKEDK